MNLPSVDLNKNRRKKNRLELLDQLVGSRMQGIAPSDAGRQTFNNLNIERREPIVNVDDVGRGMEEAGASLKSFQEEKVKTPFDEALNFAFKTLPGNSIELGGQIMQLNDEQAVELAKTIGLEGAELANRVAQATKSPQETGQLVKDTMSWIAKNVGTTEQLTELLNSLTVGDVMGGGSLAVTPFIKKGLKKTLKNADATSTKKKSEDIRNTIGRAELSKEQIKKANADLNEIKKINADIDLIKGVRGSTDGVGNAKVEKGLFQLRERKFAEYVQKYGYDNEFAIEMRKHYDSTNHPERSKLTTVIGDTKVYTDTPAARRREDLRGNLPPGERAVASYSRIPGMRDPSERRVRPYEDLVGYEGVITMGDRTDSGIILDAIGDIKTNTPVGGGGLYSFHMGKNVETGEQAWASMNPIAEKFQDKIVSVHEATGRPVLGVHMLMGQDASNFSVPVVQAMVSQLDQIKIPKSDLSKFDEVVNKEINIKNEKIRVNNKKELEQAKKEGRDPILEEEVVPFVGLNDPRYFDQLLGLNEFPREGSGGLRLLVFERMSKVTIWGPFGFPNYKDVLKAVNVDELEKLRTGSSGYSLFEFDPSVDPKKLPASPHPSYAYGIPGKDFGRLERADIPFHVMYPDIAEQTRHQTQTIKAKIDTKTGKEIPEHEIPKTFDQHRFTGAFGKKYSQPFDERWLQGILDFVKQNPMIDGSNIPLAFLMLGAASLNTPEGETE